jgi:hypothetical protein
VTRNWFMSVCSCALLLFRHDHSVLRLRNTLLLLHDHSSLRVKKHVVAVAVLA